MANKAGSKSLDSVLDSDLKNDHSRNVTVPDTKAIQEKRKKVRLQIGKIFEKEFDSGRVERALKRLERLEPKDYIMALSRLGTFFLPKVSEKTDHHKHSHQLQVQWNEQKTYIEDKPIDISHEVESKTGNNGNEDRKTEQAEGFGEQIAQS